MNLHNKVIQISITSTGHSCPGVVGRRYLRSFFMNMIPMVDHSWLELLVLVLMCMFSVVFMVMFRVVGMVKIMVGMAMNFTAMFGLLPLLLQLLRRCRLQPRLVDLNVHCV
jgi:hypothetical protein